MIRQYGIPLLALSIFIGFCFAEPALSNDIQQKSGPNAATDGTVEIIPGALQKERNDLLCKIFRAKAQNCGVSSYLAEFVRIQDAVKSGQEESSVRPRIESLSKGLDEQLERGKLFKSQSPQNYLAVDKTSSPTSSVSRETVDVKNKKYGGQIALGVSANQWMKKSIKAREMLKKFQNQKQAN